MRFDLHLAHWSLLYVTLISSSFLFYVVASENARYATAKQMPPADAAMASNTAAHAHPPTAATNVNTAAEATDGASIKAIDTVEQQQRQQQHTDKGTKEDITLNVLPNYKKVKKDTMPLPPAEQPAARSASHLSTTNDKVERVGNSNDNHHNNNVGDVPPAHVNPEDLQKHTPLPATNAPPGGSVSDSQTNSHVVLDSKDSDVIDENNDENVAIAAAAGDNGINSDNVVNIHSSLRLSEEEGVRISDNVMTPMEQQQQVRTQRDVPEQQQDSEIPISSGTGNVDDRELNAESLPDISDIPTVTVTELPLEILQPPPNALDSVLVASDVSGERRNSDDSVNRTVDIVIDGQEEILKDGQIVKINDSGGGADDSNVRAVDGDGPTLGTSLPEVADNNLDSQDVNPALSSASSNIPNDGNVITPNDTQQQQAPTENLSHDGIDQQNVSSPQTATDTEPASQANLTVEEVPMPVFSEWAQKQMEAAEKQAQEQEQTFNNSAQRKNNTNGNGKPPALKIRAKNYASPDCGSKIIAASAYTSNAGAVLSSSKDEYMLSLCGNRIWFVVELCEAIQAQKIELANFELYSSSPQNFTVAVSKRFPTREWSNVGRFMAQDKRAVQSFDLHPHLFGKFVRVDINSHYSMEHFCTLSLFRVFGTSEFEAFETENHPNDDLDDFDDEDLQEQGHIRNHEQNLFKSASDAVLSIVKKASELVGKPSNIQNQTFKTTQHSSLLCRTPIYGMFSCADCAPPLVESINNALTCEFSNLNALLSVADIRKDILDTRVCAKLFGIETNGRYNMLKDVRQSYYVNILPSAYIGAMCQLLAMPKYPTGTEQKNDSVTTEKEPIETSANQTIEKKFEPKDLELLEKPEKKLLRPETPIVKDKIPEAEPITTTDTPMEEEQQQLPRPLEPEESIEVTTVAPKVVEMPPTIPDKNIFNVPAEEMAKPVVTETKIPEEQNGEMQTTTSTSIESAEQLAGTTLPMTTNPPPSTTSSYNGEPTTATTATPPTAQKNEEDSNSWENIDSLFTSTPSTLTTGGAGGGNGLPQLNGGAGMLNQKNNNGGGPQTESVFIRLSNRIKALERNMSLSGQYLEELSRRYKKQVEELQQTLSQQSQTVRTLEEQNRRHHELEELYAQRNSQLKDELDDLTLQVQACIVVIIFVGAFVFLVLMVAILFYRSLRRDTKEILALHGRSGKATNATSSATNLQKKLARRKSFEDRSDQSNELSVNNSASEKVRRPSEEVMLILKDCKGEPKMVIAADNEIEDLGNGSGSQRQRKISICYGSNNNINNSNNGASGAMPLQKSNATGAKRKGEKHSWPNTAQAQLQAQQHLEQLNAEAGSRDLPGPKSKLQLTGKSKKKKDYLRRQESSPVESTKILNQTAPAELNNASDYDEKLMLDEDDLDNFIPTADLAYNEFMPDGPRGYQCLALPPNPAVKKGAQPKGAESSGSGSGSSSKKARRLSSPVFFKSPFTKSFKGKITSSKSNPPHESTSWEWYRLKKSSSANSANTSASSTNNAYMRVSPNASVDSSSLSEINFPTNCTENSFRILEEAILSSGESAIINTHNNANTNGSSPTSNGLGNGRSVAGAGSNVPGWGDSGNRTSMTSGISSSSNSNRSSSSNSSSNQSKKKGRSFNKIFRKVF